MTTAVERESKVSRVVPRKITVQPQTGDWLPHRLLTGAGVAIFYGVLFGLAAWNVYQVFRRILR